MLINNEITASLVKLVFPDGTLHQMPLATALHVAADNQQDLVQVSNDDIPIVKIYDYQKQLYQQKKNKKKSTIVVKEIQFRSDTQDHDLGIKIKQVLGFLSKGYQVKIQMQVTISRRNPDAMQLAKQSFDSFISKLGEYAVVQPMQATHKNYSIWIKPC